MGFVGMRAMERPVMEVGLGIVVRILGLAGLMPRIVDLDASQRLGLATRCSEVGRRLVTIG